MTAQPFGHLARRQLGTASGKSDSRKKLRDAVHGAASRLGLTDDDRHAIQFDITGKASLTNMTLSEIGQVLDRLNKDRSGERGAKRPHEAKIRALWWTLYWLGEVREPNDHAINAFVSKRFGISNLRFVDHGGGAKIIEGLKAIAARAGVIWPCEARLKTLAGAHNPKLTIQRLERHAVLAAIWQRLIEAGQTARGSDYYHYLSPALGLEASHYLRWSETELDSGIRILGKKLRRLRKASAEDAQ
jgi:hypothetical protein